MEQHGAEFPGFSFCLVCPRVGTEETGSPEHQWVQATKRKKQSLNQGLLSPAKGIARVNLVKEKTSNKRENF